MSPLPARRRVGCEEIKMIDDRLVRLHALLRLAATNPRVPGIEVDAMADSAAEVLMILRGEY